MREGRRRSAAAVLAERHALAVIVVDAPAGFGRTELLRRAVAESPGPKGARDVVVGAAHLGDVGALVRHVAGALGLDGADLDDDLLAALARGVRTGPVAVVADDLHRAPADVVRALGEAARALPPDASLVLGGTGLEDLAIAELVLDGVAVRLDRHDLTTAPPSAAATGDEQLDRWPASARARRSGDAELVDATLRAALARDVGDDERRLLAALVATGSRDRRTADAVAAIVSPGVAVGRLERLPLIDVDDLDVRIHPLWSFAGTEGVDGGEPVEPDLLSAAVSGAVDVAMAQGDLEGAGQLAVHARAVEPLRRVVRHVLGCHPPRVRPGALTTWERADVLPADDPHGAWLATAAREGRGAPLRELFDAYEAARKAFAERGDHVAEIAVGLTAGVIARQLEDLGAILGFVLRAQELAAAGVAVAEAPARLGEALAGVMAGDQHAALAALASIPADALDGDWRAQVSMMRGTSLLLLERHDEAIAHLSAATGAGGPWSLAIASGLLAQARWHQGDRHRALADLEVAEEAGLRAQAGAEVLRAQCDRAVFLAAMGDPDAPAALAPLLRRASGSGESARLVLVAEALLAIANGDLEGARAIVEPLDPPDRPVRSTPWIAALQVALVEGTAERWAKAAETYWALAGPVEAGRLAAAHLAGGAPAPPTARSFLPASWCKPARPVVEVSLLGTAAVRRDRVPVEHPAWERARVRELCLYLSLCRDPRELVAEQLWPDLTSANAGKNLRVTLSYLLDVLDPDRERGTSSAVLVEANGTLALCDDDHVRVDLRTLRDESEEVLRAATAGDESAVVATARRLARLPRGRALAGATIGAWHERHERARADLVLRAVSTAAPAALRAGDPELVEALVELGLSEDPFAERLHQLAIRSRLARDDLDGARRALRRAEDALASLGITPEPGTRALARTLRLP